MHILRRGLEQLFEQRDLVFDTQGDAVLVQSADLQEQQVVELAVTGKLLVVFDFL